MTTVWAATEQSVNERRMAPPDVSAFTHARLDTMPSRMFQRAAHAPEHVVHHPRGQLAGVRVLPARVVAPDQRLAVRQLVPDAVTEGRTRPDDHAALLQQLQVGVEGNLSEPDHDAYARERGEL